jgi:hypothetical protein
MKTKSKLWNFNIGFKYGWIPYISLSGKTEKTDNTIDKIAEIIEQQHNHTDHTIDKIVRIAEIIEQQHNHETGDTYNIYNIVVEPGGHLLDAAITSRHHNLLLLPQASPVPLIGNGENLASGGD